MRKKVRLPQASDPRSGVGRTTCSLTGLSHGGDATSGTKDTSAQTLPLPGRCFRLAERGRATCQPSNAHEAFRPSSSCSGLKHAWARGRARHGGLTPKHRPTLLPNAQGGGAPHRARPRPRPPPGEDSGETCAPGPAGPLTRAALPSRQEPHHQAQPPHTAGSRSSKKYGLSDQELALGVGARRLSPYPDFRKPLVKMGKASARVTGTWLWFDLCPARKRPRFCHPALSLPKMRQVHRPRKTPGPSQALLVASE